MSSKTLEISGQCEKCKDFFSVELVPTGRIDHKRPNMRFFRPLLTAHLAYANHELMHNPKRCNGRVRLYGSLRAANFNGSK